LCREEAGQREVGTVEDGTAEDGSEKTDQRRRIREDGSVEETK
jgi:hypothetical protein